MNVSFVTPPEQVSQADGQVPFGDTVSQTNVLSFARINVVYLTNFGGKIYFGMAEPNNNCHAFNTYRA